MRSILKIVAAAAVVLLMSECATGPQVQKSLDGNYSGSLSGTPFATITFTISGSNITGQGNVTDRDPPLWRGRDEIPHMDITGSLDGRQISTMMATVRMEHNDAQNVFDDPPIWNTADATLSFTGIFNNQAAVDGSFQGQLTANPSTTLGGTWIAAKGGAAASGILKP